MALTRTEKERIKDSRLKIQSASHTLSQVDAEKIPDYEEIQSCLETADKTLGGALRDASEN
ncbi:MAG TPA: hypothetical protein VJ732_02970 [Bryobacteraceae bacterium]|nr:hypothetical protein [Bryobacteraceae bacterium]